MVIEDKTPEASVTPSSSDVRVGIVIPTYNAEPFWPELQASLTRQGISPEDVLIVDSSSRDRTGELARQSGYSVRSLPKHEFGHGSTRQMACELLPDVDLLVYLTQDAILPEATAFANLCRALADPTVGAAYGRQAPRPNANPIERHARLFNYPEASRTMTFECRKTYGIKAAFCSNSFAVYRRSALMQVGGFPRNVILAEDSVVAARLLMAGWKVIYQADAVAVHSHPLRLRQEFRRYFDTGAHHAREQWLLDTFGSASSEGRMFLFSELRYLQQQAPLLIPVSLLRTCNKLLAYRLGRMQRYLPGSLTRTMSAHPDFWSSLHGKKTALNVDRTSLNEIYKSHSADPALVDILPPGAGRRVDPSAST